MSAKQTHMLSSAVVQPKPNRPNGDMLHDCTCDTTKTCAHGCRCQHTIARLCMPLQATMLFPRR